MRPREGLTLQIWPNAGHRQASQRGRGLHRRLTEEEVDLVIIWVFTLRDPKTLINLGSESAARRRGVTEVYLALPPLLFKPAEALRAAADYLRSKF